MTEQKEEIPQSRDHLVKVFNEGVPVYLKGNKVELLFPEKNQATHVYYKSSDASRTNWRAGYTEWYNFRIKKLSAPVPTAEERLGALEQEVKDLKSVVSRMRNLTGVYG